MVGGFMVLIVSETDDITTEPHASKEEAREQMVDHLLSP